MLINIKKTKYLVTSKEPIDQLEINSKIVKQNNKYINTESRVKIYKTAVTPIITYAAETRPDTSRTLQMMKTVEMKTLGSTQGKTLEDRVRSEDIRMQCGMQNIGRWVRRRRRFWNKHVERMEDNRLAKNAKMNNPVGRRPQGRPPKRWRECWTSSSGEDVLTMSRH
ncbi:uncharacterized protein LOC125505293 [Dendroctonus ponderosae]|uniref:uncharacterized protein LOC125505293 n=1 Tax=Dendroctonus ponderosae TaxID=77166 RepID=UPI0020362EF9|nr:uncharacterized protein LOC125505293 [Dendroctonus ponderosae]